MDVENPDDDEGVAVSFVFKTSDVEEQTQWVKAGYFEDSADVAAMAYTMLRQAMRHLINDEKVIVKFDAIVIDMEFEIPAEAKRKVLQ